MFVLFSFMSYDVPDAVFGDLPNPMYSKNIYFITPKGDEYFRELMLALSEKLESGSVMEFNALLLNIGQLDKLEGLDILYKIKNQFAREVKALEQKYKQLKISETRKLFGQKALLTQVHTVVSTLLDLMEQFIEEYEKFED